MRLQDKRQPAYTDLDLMPFGKFKGKPLQDVPASYFKWLYGEMRPKWEEFSRDFSPTVTMKFPAGYKESDHKLYNYIHNVQDALHLEIKEDKRKGKVMFELPED